MRTLSLISLGACLGYPAAQGPIGPARTVLATTNSPNADPGQTEACCSEGTARGSLLPIATTAPLTPPVAALAAHDNAVEAAAAQSGKKPNILIIWVTTSAAQASAPITRA